MKVSRRSWHFRLYQFMCGTYNIGEYDRDYRLPKSLCSYFWSIVAMVALIPLAAVIALIIAVFVGPFYWYFEKSEAHKRRVVAKKAKQAERGEKVKEPGLVSSFIAARKQKVCPIIEVVD